jgi:hypothetical protein
MVMNEYDELQEIINYTLPVDGDFCIKTSTSEHIGSQKTILKTPMFFWYIRSRPMKRTSNLPVTTSLIHMIVLVIDLFKPLNGSDQPPVENDSPFDAGLH